MPAHVPAAADRDQQRSAISSSAAAAAAALRLHVAVRCESVAVQQLSLW
eukprot:COSAG01_NODE_44172_length_421_cov_15.040373_1_plen_48_part_10